MAHFRSRIRQDNLRLICPTSLVLLASLAIGSGVILRLVGLTRRSLWLDEVMTHTSLAKPSIAEMLKDVEISLPSFYFLAVRGWIWLWGLTDASLRLPSALLGVICLPVTLIVWRPIIGQRASLWATIMLALNSYHIDYSQDAKMYISIWLLATISSGMFLRIVLSSDNRRATSDLICYGITNALLPLINYVGIVPIAAQCFFGLVLAIWRPKRTWAVVDLGVVAVIASIPTILWALPGAIEASDHRQGISWIPPLFWWQVPREVYGFLGAILLGYRQSSENPVGILANFLAVMYLPCLAAVVFLLIRSLLHALKSHNVYIEHNQVSSLSEYDRFRKEIVVFLAIWLVAPIIGDLAFSLFIRPLWGPPRYLFGAAPALLLWLGVALGDIRRRELLVAVTTTLLCVNSAMITFGRVTVTRIPWPEVAAAIAEATVATNPVGDETLAITSLMNKHYFDKESLRHALSNHQPKPLRPLFSSMDEVLPQLHPFVIVMVIYMGQERGDAMRHEVEELTPAYRCVQLYGRSVFQEPYTSMPTPYMRHSVEVWLCSPVHSQPTNLEERVTPSPLR